jgi:hypothetical protein
LRLRRQTERGGRDSNASDEPPSEPEKQAGSSSFPPALVDETPRVSEPTPRGSRPFAADDAQRDADEQEIEALYLAAVRAGRWEDADELRAIRKARRERAAGNVVDLASRRHGVRS